MNTTSHVAQRKSISQHTLWSASTVYSRHRVCTKYTKVCTKLLSNDLQTEDITYIRHQLTTLQINYIIGQ